MRIQLRGRTLSQKSTIVGVGRPGLCEGLGHCQAVRVPMCNCDSSEVAHKKQAYAQDHLPQRHGDLLQTEFSSKCRCFRSEILFVDITYLWVLAEPSISWNLGPVLWVAGFPEDHLCGFLSFVQALLCTMCARFLSGLTCSPQYQERLAYWIFDSAPACLLYIFPKVFFRVLELFIHSFTKQVLLHA